jgi:hypothetical protein
MKTRKGQSSANRGASHRVESQVPQQSSAKPKAWSGFEQAILRYWPRISAEPHRIRG